MSDVDQKRFRELTLARGSATDSLLFKLPTLPDRMALVRANTMASGWTPEDVEEGRPGSKPAIGEDLMAVRWATVGLCWTGERLTADLRTCRSEAIAAHREPETAVMKYGDLVVTELFERGYDSVAVATAGGTLFDWMMEVTFPNKGVGDLEKVSSEAVFSEPPAGQATSGAL